MGDERVVVIADDEEMVRDFLKAVFSRTHCRILEASDGEEAVELVRREGDRIALVMLDAVMPRKGGIEALPEVVREVPHAHVVLFSGNPEPFRGKALSLGAHRVLSKPFRVKELIHLLDEALAHAGQEAMTPAKAL